MAIRNLRKIAIEKTVLSPLMTDREKIDNADVIKNFPDGVTIIAIDIVDAVNPETGEVDSYGVYHFTEDKNVFACGGLVLTNIFSAWIEECGSVDAVNDELKKMGGIRVRLEESRTKSKRAVTTVVII